MNPDPIDSCELDVRALRAQARDTDEVVVQLSGRAALQLVRELDRIPALQAELAGRRTVDVVVAGIVR